MPISMSRLSVPAFERGLGVFSVILDKAENHAAAKKIDEAIFIQARLYPDMRPLAAQVQMASDTAKGAVARLAGLDVPSFADTETTFAALKERVARTLEFIRSVPSEAIDGSETRSVVLKSRSGSQTFEGQTYLLGFALPNFYFHLTTAYAILRHNGVEVGKLDYLGAPPQG
jgi:uncharacterized protein